MKVINFGSLNIDHVYAVPHFVKPGETLSSRIYRQFCGGKGCNQSIALAFAGAKVVHVGRVGAEGAWLVDHLASCGVDISLTKITDQPTGHAIIQVTPEGENAIIIHGGANQALDTEDVDAAIAIAEPGDVVLTQNETSCVWEMLTRAKAAGMLTAFNPAPMTPDLVDQPLDCVDLLIVNQIEAEGLTGNQGPEEQLQAMLNRYPGMRVVLTLGRQGATYRDQSDHVHGPAQQVKPMDTTAAGDTFIGYFLAEMMKGHTPDKCLSVANRAAALCVQRAGAASSIPRRIKVGETTD